MRIHCPGPQFKCHQSNDSLHFAFNAKQMENPADRKASSGASSNSTAIWGKQPSTHLHIGELARDAGRHISSADPDPRREAFSLIPPLATMRMAKKKQVYPIRKNTHVDSQTLQNKHRRSSAKRPTLTVQARKASLLEPRKFLEN